MVAMKCGPKDFHFIRLTAEGWYSKSGDLVGMIVSEDEVLRGVWRLSSLLRIEGIELKNDLYYDDETIVFAVKVGWDN